MPTRFRLLAIVFFISTGHWFSANAISAPFVIAPMIEGVGFCLRGLGTASVPEAMAACASEPNPSAALIQAQLNKLEPGGASGRVQVGYTVGINLMGYLRPDDLLNNLIKIQALIDSVNRPIVLYLIGNQFASPPPEVIFSKSSYSTFSDQTVPKESYFASQINAWTLNLDPTLDVNRIRFGSLKIIGKWYSTLPQSLKNRIFGITLAGELHHFFPDFSNGMGRYDAIRVTDYSPASVMAFRDWLRHKYPNLVVLNQKLGSQFKSFDAISAPALDIRRDKLDGFSQHFDAYAHGVLPIEGWLYPLPDNSQIQIYLDGRWLGNAEYGLSRQDVYEGARALTHAGVGFRYWVDFSHLPKGIHTIQVLLADKKKVRQIAMRKIVLMPDNQAAPFHFNGEAAFSKASIKQRFWLDQPREMQDYYFNPLAGEWADFRSQQVSTAYRHWFETAIANGLPPEKLYSHQIASATVGTWNPLLTASDASLSGLHAYKKGINLYGGSLNTDLIKRHYVSPGETFAVPEFHTQNWRDPFAAERVFKSFRKAGASFMTPYFMTIYPKKFRIKGNPHDKFLISPDNKTYGSHHLYRAIQRMANDKSTACISCDSK